MNRRLGTSY
uniref:Uncharacterized protein n=1 Tax=Arundo donax TaxID=35708 RepID=A0A0A8Y674_ARUDO